MRDYEERYALLKLQPKFKTYHVDAYECSTVKKATANAIFMSNLSPVGSLNDDTVAPRYDSNIQEQGYIENIVSNNESYDGATSPGQYINGHVLIKQHNPVSMCDSEETLILAEEIRLKNACENNLLLIRETDLRLLQLSVLKNLNNAREHLTKFDECISVVVQLRTKLYSVTPFPKSKVIPKVIEKNDLSELVTSHLTTNKIIEKCTKVLPPGMLKIETEPINAYFKNNRVVHRDYLKVTKEHIATPHELLEEARALKPLDEHIGYASKFAE
ncbi:hypothetical protein Tco_0856702 [Tanacetum coccineum]|uniref:Uncharacterized protein n=1 Tax=Tanacetum coccineum TaxID=301880 RepID=A0ABQ5B440_9ASTR